MRPATNAAVEAFRAANANQLPADPAQLAPYLRSAIDLEFIRRRLANWNRL